MIESGLDQAIMLTAQEQNIFVEVDKAVKAAIQEKSIEDIVAHLLVLSRTQQISGLVKARVLFLTREAWDGFGIGEEFEDYIYATTGISPQTTRKYLNLWTAIYENPQIAQETKTALMGKPIQGQLLLTGAAREGSIGDSDWDRIIAAPDTSTIREIVREIRGSQTSSDSAIVITLRRDGTLSVRKGGDGPFTLGALALTDPNITVQQAIERIINSAGIVRQ